MPKQRFTTEEIIHKLREADVLSGQGRTVVDICKQLGMTDTTYFRCRKGHGGLRIDQAKRMKELEAENARLKKAVAELTIDKIILKEVAEGNLKPNATATGGGTGAISASVFRTSDLSGVGHFKVQLALCPRAEIR
jgi:transposase-like protein